MPPSESWKSFLIDEDLPRSLAADLRTVGIDVTHVTEVGLSGATDDTIRDHAVQDRRVVVSRDLGMFDARRGQRPSGLLVVLVRIPTSIPLPEFKRIVVAALTNISSDPPDDARIAVIEPGRIRLRG